MKVVTASQDYFYASGPQEPAGKKPKTHDAKTDAQPELSLDLDGRLKVEFSEDKQRASGARTGVEKYNNTEATIWLSPDEILQIVNFASKNKIVELPNRDLIKGKLDGVKHLLSEIRGQF